MTRGQGGTGGVTHRPPLTSEVVADTKCRQELVEVISKPWGDRREA